MSFGIVVPGAQWSEIGGAGFAAGAGAVGVAVGLVVVELALVGWAVAGREEALGVDGADMVG